MNLNNHKRRVYKVLVCRKGRVRNPLASKCFWKYFYSLSELAAYMQKSSDNKLFFPTLQTILTKEELNILNKKLSSKATVNLMPESDFKRFYTTIVLGWED